LRRISPYDPPRKLSGKPDETEIYAQIKTTPKTLHPDPKPYTLNLKLSAKTNTLLPIHSSYVWGGFGL